MDIQQCRLKHFPVSFFSIILGLAGFTIALQKTETVLKVPLGVSFYVLVFSLILFGMFLFLYLIKILLFFQETIKEFNDPIKLNFFPTFSISLLLFAIAFLGIDMSVSKYFCLSGLIIHFIFTLKIISIWIQKTNLETKHMNPAWFIPAVGNILVPISGIFHFSQEISWFFFSVGFLFWVILLVIFFNRIIFHQPLPEKLLPTLFILIAPPAVGFISYVKLTEEVDNFARILYYFGLFLVFLFFFQIKMFQKIKFYLSSWAYSFPLAAITIASILMFHKTEIVFFRSLSFGFIAILTVLIFILTIKTIQAVKQRKICVEER